MYEVNVREDLWASDGGGCDCSNPFEIFYLVQKLVIGRIINEFMD